MCNLMNNVKVEFFLYQIFIHGLMLSSWLLVLIKPIGLFDNLFVLFKIFIIFTATQLLYHQRYMKMFIIRFYRLKVSAYVWRKIWKIVLVSDLLKKFDAWNNK